MKQRPPNPAWAAGLCAAALAFCSADALAQSSIAVAPIVNVERLDHGLTARELASGVYVVEGANADFSVANGCNIINTGFIVTDAGVLVINSGPGRIYGEQLRALIGRTTRQPVVQVLHLNLHPDYFLGNQAYADVPRRATALTSAGMAREAAGYESNLYRLCGDWMKGTQALLPDAAVEAPPRGGTLRVGKREFELHEFNGHTDSDLVLIDRESGVAFVGGLVFVDRIPTTPHARVDDWLRNLDRLQPLLVGAGVKTLVPSHGPVRASLDGIAQTRSYLQWLDQHFSLWARQGWEMNEVLRAPVPVAYRGWAGFETEYVRNVVHLYPRYESQVLAATRQR